MAQASSPLAANDDPSTPPPTSLSVAAVQGASLDALVQSKGSVDEALRLILNSYATTGLQASCLAAAREALQAAWRTRLEEAHAGRPTALILLSYTSNLISSGLRDMFAYLAKHCLVDGFVTTAGGVEEDVIKCLGSTIIGDFAMKGEELRKQGMNRVGNLLVPNDNYVRFETFINPVLKALHAEQRACRWNAASTTPTHLIRKIGGAMQNLERREESVVYWCSVNNIPIYCPAITDGSIGDMIFFYDFNNPGLVVDPVPDYFGLQRQLLCKRHEGEPVGGSLAIVLGGGLPKHHLLRGGRFDTVVLVTTGNEADGCVSSSALTDDYSERLLHATTHVVKVQGDATVIFPLAVFGLPQL
jgi:deoxyhypusine synthase